MSSEQLRRDGLAGPYDLADKSGLENACEVARELKALRRQQLKVARMVGLEDPGQNPNLDRHMDIACFRSLYFDANVQSVVSELFGNDLFVWRSNFFVKSDGVGENKWHHDRHFENGDAPLALYDTSNHFTILFALTDIDMDAGRIEYIKGSHQPIEGWDRDIPRHIDEVPKCVQNRVTPLLFKQGQFAVFHSSLLHRSLAFGEGEGRVSMAARVARKGTKIPEYDSPSTCGGAHAAAEPVFSYRDTAIMALN